jgi:Fe2+ transport system protein FeoA
MNLSQASRANLTAPIPRAKRALSRVSKGSNLRVIDIPQGVEGTRLIRLGMVRGAFIKCLKRLPGGTVVIGINRQEIAIGASLAGIIFVESATDKPSAAAGEEDA